MKKMGLSVTFHKKRSILGLALGVLFAVLFFTQSQVNLETNDSLGSAQYLGIPVALAFLLIGSVSIRSDRKGWQWLLNIAWAVAAAGVTLLWSFTAVDAITVWQMGLKEICLNIAIFFLIAMLVYLISLKWKLSVSIAAMVLFLLALTNGLVWQFRGKELLFSDLMAVGTAAKVAGEYSALLTMRMTIGLALWTLVMLAQFAIPNLQKGSKLGIRCAVALLEVLMIAAVMVGMGQMKVKSWETHGTVKNGLYMNFLLSMRDSIIAEPEGYSETVIAELESQYTVAENEKTPNIIVIMNESFADFDILGNEVKTNIPVKPFFDSLQENTIRGYALTPALGGSTCNAEFEFLTGHSIACLPAGSNPYQQYMDDSTFSLAWLAQAYGYECVATHPMPATGWSRDKVYPLLGFQDASFIEEYPQEQMVRNHVSDQEVYEKVLDILENNESNLFLFGITMQNHGGYIYEGENYTKTVELDGYGKDYPQAEQYLTLLHESDKALEYLLGELENYPEDTLVVFFGDHFPNVEASFFEEVHGGGLNALDEQLLKRTVPFVIWANYDIPEQTIECTSLNYLGRYMLEAAGMELPAYYQFLKEMETVIPAFNHMAYYSAEQGEFLTLDQAAGKEKDWLEKYGMLQYNSLFDSKNRSEHFFGKYTK